jgi:hypothetical protein
MLAFIVVSAIVIYLLFRILHELGSCAGSLHRIALQTKSAADDSYLCGIHGILDKWDIDRKI